MDAPRHGDATPIGFTSRQAFHNTCPSVLRGARSVRLGELAVPNGQECLHRRRECCGINIEGDDILRGDGSTVVYNATSRLNTVQLASSGLYALGENAS